MKKLLFLAFILTASACELQSKTNITYNHNPDKDPIPVPELPIQTTRDEWIRLVRGRVIIDTTSSSEYFRDNSNLGSANAAKLYTFCNVANGQNKAVYKYHYYHGFEIKNNTLYIYSENYNLGNGWVNSNQIIFDQNNPLVSTEVYTLN